MGRLVDYWPFAEFRLAYAFDARNPRDVQYLDGATGGEGLVRKSAHLQSVEREQSMAAFAERTRILYPHSRWERASTPDLRDLYNDVRLMMEAPPQSKR